MSHSAQRCGKVGGIVDKKKSCDGERIHAMGARVVTLRLEEPRVGEKTAHREQNIARRAGERYLAARRAASHQ